MGKYGPVRFPDILAFTGVNSVGLGVAGRPRLLGRLSDI
jgi:hypothetical protein